MSKNTAPTQHGSPWTKVTTRVKLDLALGISVALTLPSGDQEIKLFGNFCPTSPYRTNAGAGTAKYLARPPSRTLLTSAFVCQRRICFPQNQSESRLNETPRQEGLVSLLIMTNPFQLRSRGLAVDPNGIMLGDSSLFEKGYAKWTWWG